MKKLILALLFLSGTLFSQTGASFKFGDISSWWTPKVFMYGNSTYWHDSSNYQTTNKSVYVLDSMKVGKDLYVGVKGGSIFLDTSRQGRIYFDGFNLTVQNLKTSTLLLSSAGGVKLTASLDEMFLEGFLGVDIFDASDAGLFLRNSNGDTLRLGTGSVSVNRTGQIKLPSDTATDYDANDAVTINRQSGIITTKPLTTATTAIYDLTLVNSLATSTSKLFVTVVYGGGTNTAACFPVHVLYSAGNWVISIYNVSGSSLNGTVQLRYVIFN